MSAILRVAGPLLLGILGVATIIPLVFLAAFSPKQQEAIPEVAIQYQVLVNEVTFEIDPIPAFRQVTPRMKRVRRNAIQNGRQTQQPIYKNQTLMFDILLNIINNNQSYDPLLTPMRLKVMSVSNPDPTTPASTQLVVVFDSVYENPCEYSKCGNARGIHLATMLARVFTLSTEGAAITYVNIKHRISNDFYTVNDTQLLTKFFAVANNPAFNYTFQGYEITGISDCIVDPLPTVVERLNAKVKEMYNPSLMNTWPLFVSLTKKGATGDTSTALAIFLAEETLDTTQPGWGTTWECPTCSEVYTNAKFDDNPIPVSIESILEILPLRHAVAAC